MSQSHREQRVAGRAAKRGAQREVGQRGRGRVAKAVLETLEDRRLMSSVSLSGGVLSVEAGSDAQLKAWVNYKKSSNTIEVYANGQRKQTFNRSDITSMRIVGGAGDDSVYVEPDVTVPADIRTGTGDDRITAGGGDDVIDAGAGDDVVRGQGGNDMLYGGQGDDKLYGGQGDDALDGGAGDDRLEGNDGDDALLGGGGDDKLFGGQGNDALDGQAGDDRLDGGGGNDVMHTDAADDDRAVSVRRGDQVVTAGTDTEADPSDPPPGSVQVGDDAPGDGGDDTPPDDGEAGGSTDTGSDSGAGTGSNTNAGTDTNAGGGDTTDPNAGGGSGNSSSSDDTGGAPATDENGNPTPDDALAPRPVIEFIGKEGMAGHTVHFNALKTTLATNDPIGTRYEWDFGDAGGAYNKLTGWTAAHTYDKAGNYTVALTVTDAAGRRTKVTATVRIAVDTRRAIYVDSDGSDANTGATPKLAVKSLARAAQLAGDNTEILLRNGETFDVAEPVYFHNKNLTIGTYGTGAKARLRKVESKTNSTTMIYLAGGSDDVVVEGIEFDSKWTLDSSYREGKVPARALTVFGTNITVRDCTFRNVTDAVNALGKPTGLLVQGNTFTNELRGYGVWGEGTDHVYLGNTFRRSTMEHLIRTSNSGVTRLLLAYNDLNQEGNTKGAMELRVCKWFYVVGNHVNGGTFRAGLQEDAAYEPNWKSEFTGNGVLEDNQIAGNVFVNFRPGVQHVALRNNVIERDGAEAILIECVKKGYDQVRKTDDVRVEGNTVLNGAKTGSFLQLSGHATNLVVRNNLYVAPNLQATGGGGATAIAVADATGQDPMASFKDVSDNVWPEVAFSSRQGGLNYVWSSWGDTRGYQSPAKWEAYAQVRGDVYRDVTVGATYQTKAGGVVAGSSLRAA